MMHRPAGTWRIVRTIFHVGLGALLALYVGFFVVKCLADIRCPYVLDYGEGLVLSQALRLAHGENLYNDYTHYPFVVSNYPPLFIALSALGVKLFGVSFTFGRALAFAAMLGVGAMMTLLLRRCRVGLAPALAAPAFLLSTAFVTLWAGWMRVDTLALLFVMAGLYFVLRGGRWLILAVLLMVAASYTKQSMIAGVAASFVYLWWIGERRNALLFLGSWAAAGFALFMVFQIASDGWFYRHMVTGNAHPWHADRAWWWAKATGERWPVLIGMAVVTAVAALASAWRRGSNHDQGDDGRQGERLLAPYFGFAAVAAVTAGKVGAYINYMIEPLAAACLLGALGYEKLTASEPSRRSHVLWIAAAAALAAQAIAMWAPPWRWEAQRNLQAEGARAAAQIIAKTKGDIIGEPVGILVTSGRPVLLDPATCSHMCLAGNWDPTVLLRDIRGRRFSLIFMSGEALWGRYEYGLYGHKWTGPLMQAIKTHYRVSGHAGNTWLLEPMRSETKGARSGKNPAGRVATSAEAGRTTRR